MTPPLYLVGRSRDRLSPVAGIGSVTGILVKWLQEIPPPLLFGRPAGRKTIRISQEVGKGGGYF